MPLSKSRLVSRPDKSRSAIRAGAAVMVAGAGLLASASPALAHTVAPLPFDLNQGTSGPLVKELQHGLHIRANGHFNARTEHAVVAFQRKDHLSVDGIVGPQTWSALFHVAETATTSSTALPVTADEASSSADAGNYTIPAAIVECESGGDYSAVNPSSGAGGAYQILPSTWAAYGGQGLPEDASPAEQNEIAAQIYAADGPSAWSC